MLGSEPAIAIVNGPQRLKRQFCRERCGMGEVKMLIGGFYRNYFIAHREVNKLSQRMETKLKHNFAAMSLHGSDRDSELRGDLFIGLALG